MKSAISFLVSNKIFIKYLIRLILLSGIITIVNNVYELSSFSVLFISIIIGVYIKLSYISEKIYQEEIG